MIDWRRDFYIHTPYQHQAEHVCEILDSLGYRWGGGNALLGRTNWKHNESRMHYHVHPQKMYITFSSCPEDFPVHSYEEFIAAFEPDTPISISEFL